MKRILFSLLCFFSLTSLYSESTRQMINSTTTQPTTNSNTPSLYQSEAATPPQTPLTSYSSYRPEIERQAFYIGAEYLYWKLDESGMNYAITNNSPTAYDPANMRDVMSLVRNFHQVDFHYDSGVRGWLGYRVPDYFWEIEGEYTFYYTSDRQHVTRKPPPLGILDGTFPEFTRSPIERASSRFNFHYHTARLQLARPFFVGKTILIRPFFGMQGAWISQKWAVTYTGGDGEKTFFQNNWDYEAGGIHLGLNSEWYIAYGLGLFMNGTLSSLYGNHRLLCTMDPEIFTGGPFQKITPNEHRVAQALQLSAGITWGMAFDPIAFRILLGYELNTWFNINELYRVNLAGNGTTAPNNEKIPLLTNTSLNLQGLIAGFVLEF